MQSLNRYDDLIAKSSLFIDKQKQIGSSWQVLPMRPVLRHCFLVPYVLLSALGSESGLPRTADLFLFSGIKETFRKDIFMTEVIA